MGQRKLRELVLYIAQTCQADPNFGMVKLNKVLFNADFGHYLRTGTSITGEEYIKWENGPIVRRMKPILRDAEADRDLDIEQVEVAPNYVQKRVVARREPDLSGFSKEEIAMVDQSIQALAGMTANQIIEYFHQYLGWQVADQGEVIPYQTVFFMKRLPTKDEAEYALTLEKAI